MERMYPEKTALKLISGIIRSDGEMMQTGRLQMNSSPILKTSGISPVVDLTDGTSAGISWRS